MFFESRIFPTIAEMSEAALAEILRISNDAVSKRGRFSIALAGGHTPAKLYALWAEKYKTQTPWDRVHLFFGDERFVPEDDLLSNYRMARQTLIDHVPIPKENVHPMLTEFPSPDKAAEAYEVELRRFFGEGAPALDEQRRWVVAVTAPAEPPQRLTLTPVVLNQGLNTFFLVAGENKREILTALRSEPQNVPSKYPAGRIRPARGVVWYLDQAAAG